MYLAMLPASKSASNDAPPALGPSDAPCRHDASDKIHGHFNVSVAEVDRSNHASRERVIAVAAISATSRKEVREVLDRVADAVSAHPRAEVVSAELTETLNVFFCNPGKNGRLLDFVGSDIADQAAGRFIGRNRPDVSLRGSPQSSTTRPSRVHPPCRPTRSLRVAEAIREVVPRRRSLFEVSDPASDRHHGDSVPRSPATSAAPPSSSRSWARPPSRSLAMKKTPEARLGLPPGQGRRQAPDPDHSPPDIQTRRRHQAIDRDVQDHRRGPGRTTASPSRRPQPKSKRKPRLDPPNRSPTTPKTD